MNNELNQQIGNRVKDSRKALNYTREKFSEMVGISAQFLTEIEFGRRGMSIETLLKICEVLNITTDFILNVKAIDEKQNLIHTLEKLDTNINDTKTVIQNIMEHITKDD